MDTRRARLALPLVLAFVATTTVAAAAPPATVKAAQTIAYGNLLVGSTGLTLYHLVSEKPGSIACTGACAKTWPPLLVAAGARPLAGVGAQAAKLGTIKRPDGRVQVTYDGLALYRYQHDEKPGDVNGEAAGGVWFAVAATGKIVKPPPAEASQTSTPPAATTTSSDAGGYGY